MNDFYCVNKYQLGTGDKIVVPLSDLGLAQHHAVYIGRDAHNEHFISENVAGVGVILTKVSDFFAKHSRITRIERFNASLAEKKQLVSRVLSKQGSPYRLFTYNCEHFANDVIKRKPVSPQISAALGIGLLIIGLFVFLKN